MGVMSMSEGRRLSSPAEWAGPVTKLVENLFPLAVLHRCIMLADSLARRVPGIMLKGHSFKNRHVLTPGEKQMKYLGEGMGRNAINIDDLPRELHR